MAGELMLRMGVAGKLRDDIEQASGLPAETIDKLLSGHGGGLTLAEIERFAQTLGATVRVQLVSIAPKSG